jgi:hypothetical protein
MASRETGDALRQAPNAATCLAVGKFRTKLRAQRAAYSAVALWSAAVERQEFAHAFSCSPDHRTGVIANRTAWSSVTTVLTLNVCHAELELEDMADAFSICSAMNGLPRISLVEVCRCLQREDVAPDQTIVCEAQPALSWYLVVKGEVECHTASPTGKKLTVAKLGAGMAFGEFGLIYDQPRSATVKASQGGAVLAVLQKADYQRILKSFHRENMFAFLQRKLDFLGNWTIFEGFSSECPVHVLHALIASRALTFLYTGNALIALSYLLVFRKAKAGKVLYEKQDDMPINGCALSFVIGGTTTVYYGSVAVEGVTEMLATADRGYIFGRLATPGSVMKVKFHSLSFSEKRSCLLLPAPILFDSKHTGAHAAPSPCTCAGRG